MNRRRSLRTLHPLVRQGPRAVQLFPAESLLPGQLCRTRLQPLSLDFIDATPFARIELRNCSTLLLALVAKRSEYQNREEQEDAQDGSDPDACFRGRAETG